MNETLRKIVAITTIFVIMIAAVSTFWKGLHWSLGFLAGGAWSMANFALTLGLLDIAMLRKPRKSMNTFLLVKFPVLYLVGLAVVAWRIFPITGILTGLLTSAVIMSIVKLWPSRA